MAAGPALDLGTGAQARALAAAAQRADKALRPPQLLDHRPALFLGPLGLAELCLAQAPHLGCQLPRHNHPQRNLTR